MKNVLRGISLWLVFVVVGLYTAFVLQSLWNWFVVGSLNVSSISFWSMYGVVLIVGVFREKQELSGDVRWERTLKILDYCVPQEKRYQLDEWLKEQSEGVFGRAWTFVWEKVFGNTVTLGLGWVIHSFLT